MAKKQSTKLTYRDILTSINKGEFNPVYILMGEEDYYIDILMDAIESKGIAEEDKDFDFNLYYGVDADMDVVIAASRQLPMVSARRVVLLKEAQSKQQAKTQLDKLATYVSDPNPNAILAIAFKGDKLNATSPLIKAAAKSGAVVFESERVRDYHLASHVKDYCAGRKVGIEDKAVQLLCEYIGGPLSKLFGEVNKLIMVCGTSGRITAADIEKNIGISKDFNNFELVSALVKRNYTKAVQIVKYFKGNPKNNPTVMTTATLFNFFSKIVTAHYLKDKSDQGLMAALGIRFPNQLAEIKEGMRAFPPLQAYNAIHTLREFDIKSKGVESMQNEYDLLLELIYKLFVG